MAKQENLKQKIKIEDIENIFELEDALILLNRLSHFLEHDKFTRSDIFKKCVIINYHSYYLDNKRAVDNLIERLKKKMKLLDEIEYKIDNTSTISYVKRIWDDIFTILELFEEQISSSVRRLERGINTDFIIDIEDYQKTKIIREIEKLERPNDDDSWLFEDDFSHGLIE